MKKHNEHTETNEHSERSNYITINISDDTALRLVEQRLARLSKLIDALTIKRECSICCIEKPITYPLHLVDIDTKLNDEDKTFLLPCNLHYLCVPCLRRMALNFDSHIIGKDHSNLYCPYPFNGGCKTVIDSLTYIDHSHVCKVLNPQEEAEFLNYAYAWQFTGFFVEPCNACESPLLVEYEVLDKPIYERIIECDQTLTCVNTRHRFCMVCKRTVHSRQNICSVCELVDEYDNPDNYNYYFNKPIDEEAQTNAYDFSLERYVYKNKEITFEIAAEQIIKLIQDPHSWLICPLCKMAMIKTEKCNALVHHRIERCFACGKIGYNSYRALPDTHWMGSLSEIGCPRFYNNHYYKMLGYICVEADCFSHDIGDCKIEEHQTGIQNLERDRHKNYIYHAFKSLSPHIRVPLLTFLYKKTIDYSSIYELLPSTKVFDILRDFPEWNGLYTEQMVYDKLYETYNAALNISTISYENNNSNNNNNNNEIRNELGNVIENYIRNELNDLEITIRHESTEMNTDMVEGDI